VITLTNSQSRLRQTVEICQKQCLDRFLGLDWDFLDVIALAVNIIIIWILDSEGTKVFAGGAGPFYLRGWGQSAKPTVCCFRGEKRRPLGFWGDPRALRLRSAAPWLRQHRTASKRFRHTQRDVQLPRARVVGGGGGGGEWMVFVRGGGGWFCTVQQQQNPNYNNVYI
jgi:hypothetical protein